MNGFVKVLTGILGVLAVLACLATVGILGYSLVSPGHQNKTENANVKVVENDVTGDTLPVPSTTPKADKSPGKIVDLANHTHDYKETVVKKATCYSAGRIRYACECGDEYFVDVVSTGHVEDGWEVVRKATAEEPGLRVKKCIYCDEILASENIPYDSTSSSSSTSTGATPAPAHIHQYSALTEREPTCVLAGLRKYSCACGNFYTEMIPAAGHVASDWTVAEEATSSKMGTEQRTCVVCGVLLDTRPIGLASPTPGTEATATPATSATAAPSGATSAPTTAPTASPQPTATPHVHKYTSYVLKEANCTEKGIRSFVCTCGSSYAESIELDLNNHTYRAVVIPATNTTQGYTIYTCIRCNSSYYDNYTPPLDPVAAYKLSASPTK